MQRHVLLRVGTTEIITFTRLSQCEMTPSVGTDSSSYTWSTYTSIIHLIIGRAIQKRHCIPQFFSEAMALAKRMSCANVDISTPLLPRFPFFNTHTTESDGTRHATPTAKGISIIRELKVSGANGMKISGSLGRSGVRHGKERGQALKRA